MNENNIPSRTESDVSENENQEEFVQLGVKKPRKRKNISYKTSSRKKSKIVNL